MIQLIKAPAGIIAGMSEHQVRFYGNDTHSATTYEAIVEFFEANNNGDVLRLIFGHGSIEIKFKTTLNPLENGLEFPVGATLDEVVAVMKSNYILSKYFNIEKTIYDTINLISRGTGSFYYITWDLKQSYGQFLIDVVEPGLDAEIPDVFQAVWGIQREDESILLDELYFDIPPSMELSVDFSKILSKMLQFPLPDVDESNMVKVEARKINFYTAEFLNGSYQKRYDWGLFTYLPFSEPGENYLNELASSGRFMHPAPTRVWDDARFFLYYISIADGKTYKLKVRINFTDFLSTTREIRSIETNGGELIVIPGGITALDLYAYAQSKKIFSYTLMLYDDLTMVASTETILRVEKPLIFAEYFLFRTHTSVFHHLFELSVKRTLETTGIKMRNGNVVKYQVDEKTLELEVESAPMLKNACLLVEKGFMNNEFYWFVNGSFKPVGLVPGSFLIFDEVEELHRVSFKVQMSTELMMEVETDTTPVGSGSGGGLGSGSGSSYSVLSDGTHVLTDGSGRVLGF